MIKIKKILKSIGMLGLLLTGIFFFPVSAKADEPVVVVIDPGHGGENLGAEYEEYTEKEMTMITARAMKEELEKYDQVTVYLTHDRDMDMSIEDRALFAKEKNADFLFCLHYNTSADHDLFGAEVWVPAGGEFYAKGYSFAQIEMEELTGIGLCSRGIKTRLNNKGDNYYGILRYCSREKIPSVLIEHCHLDHARDQEFYQAGRQQLEEFGHRDAAAAAKYLGLSSQSLGVDYSQYPVPETAIPSEMVAPDKTEPELCQIAVEAVDEETGEVTVLIKAEDSDSYILYYDYSLDGGNTYSQPEPWPRTNGWNESDPELRFTVQVPFDRDIVLRAGVCNGFDVWTESNEIALLPIADPERLRAEEEHLKAEERLKAEESLKAEEYLKEEHLEEEHLEEEGRLKEQAEKQKSLAEQEKEQEMQKESDLRPLPPVSEVFKSVDSMPELLPILLIILVIIICMFFVAFYMSKMILLLVKDNKKQ